MTESDVRRTVVVAVAVTALATGCTSNDPPAKQNFPFEEAVLLAGNKLMISTLPCWEDRLQTSVDETVDTVTVTVSAVNYPKDADECGSSLAVQMSDVLGARKLVDGATGKTVAVDAKATPTS